MVPSQTFFHRISILFENHRLFKGEGRGGLPRSGHAFIPASQIRHLSLGLVYGLFRRLELFTRKIYGSAFSNPDDFATVPGRFVAFNGTNGSDNCWERMEKKKKKGKRKKKKLLLARGKMGVN